MAKKVIDRIFKTFVIIFDVAYGVFMMILAFGSLFASYYSVLDAIPQFALSFVIAGVVNGIYLILKRLIKNY